MKIQVRMRRVEVSYAIVEVEVPDDAKSPLTRAEVRARRIARDQPARFCDSDDPVVEVLVVEVLT